MTIKIDGESTLTVSRLSWGIPGQKVETSSPDFHFVKFCPNMEWTFDNFACKIFAQDDI